MKSTIILLISFAFNCTAQQDTSQNQLQKNQEIAFVYYFKVQAFCSCLEQSYKNSQIMELIEKEDLQGSYDGLAVDKIQQRISHLGKEAALNIEKEDYPDFNDKKRIMSKCLDFYNSENLELEAKSLYKTYNK